MGNYAIRLARTEDAPALLAIYRPFVEKTAISFEYLAPTVEEFAQRIAATSAEYPYIVCAAADKPVGYAYAHRYQERDAYQWDVETTVYLAPAAQGQGLGVLLCTALEKLLALQGIKNLYACITADNAKSIGMHEAMGYCLLGKFPQAGFKNGHWHGIVWLGKSVGTFSASPQPVRRFSQVDDAAVAQVLRGINAQCRT